MYRQTQRHHHHLVGEAAAAVLAVVLAACGGGNRGDALLPGELARVGASRLTAEEVRQAMPYGLSGADSAGWWRSYVADWVERKAVGIEASRNIVDTRRIERMAEEYRNDLLMLEYVREMAAQQPLADIADDSLRREYERTPELYRCTQAMVRGAYLALDRKHPRLRELRRCLRSTAAADLEKLEKASLDPSVEYIYFRDRWMLWSDLAARVPGGLEKKASEQRAGFDTTVGDRTCMLVVSDYLAPGELMPFDLARDAVAEVVRAAAAADYSASLRRALVERAYENGLITVVPEMTDTTLLPSPGNND